MRLNRSMAFVCFLAGTSVFAQNGQIQGVVQDERGAPIPGASITIGALPGYPDPKTPTVWPAHRSFNASVQTSPDGRYSLGGLPAGLYSVCASAPNRADMLPSCQWTPKPRAVIVEANRTASATVRVARGHRLTVRVNDGANRLEGRQNLIGQRLFVQVGNRDVGVQAAEGHQEGRSWVYSILVPFDKDLRLSIRGQHYTLTDVRGATTDTRGTVKVPLRAAAVGPASQTIEFSITGTFPGRN